MTSPGLRERKKQKTRWAIQEHALRLFAEQGYEATTVDQIAAAAEISPSTFFRYFRTKDDLVIEDEYDAIMEAGLRDQPADVPPLEAVRAVIRRAFVDTNPAAQAKLLERSKLVLSVPSLRARSAENLFVTIDLIRNAVARRIRRNPDDMDIRAFSGAIVGAILSVVEVWTAGDGQRDLGELVDEALQTLQDGLRLKPGPLP